MTAHDKKPDDMPLSAVSGTNGILRSWNKTSPHLRLFVRHIRASFEKQMLIALCAMEFPNLRDVVLHRKGRGPTKETVIKLAAQLFSTPSLHRIGLLHMIFPKVASFSSLFQNCGETMDSILLHNPTFDQIDTPVSPPDED
ncbi:hypothetical protein B0H11DRAFT_2217141 [Mycena galericulata]|nr:hypothetical protein B0H11DRAFT_2217141 [Mycena galericulata]